VVARQKQPIVATQLPNNLRKQPPSPAQDDDMMSKQYESKRGVDLISGVLLFVNFLGEFPRSSTYLFECVLLGAVIGYIVRLLEERLTELRRIRRMLDRYIANAQANLVLQTDEFWRLGMLQRVGAAELSERELSRLCRRIVNYGLQDPRHRETSTVFKDHRESLSGLLRWASREGIDLSDALTVMRRQAEEPDRQRGLQ
jgi:hypothetical protein